MQLLIVLIAIFIASIELNCISVNVIYIPFKYNCH
ncbi:hypothetical protein BpOF4_04965 [Alkalihalophilus pseudofirmus OF4]|uniref:Uncharacterized protein n=1 Tax=Alkalihalophilus pseudofirmus (strain ATCC BAA-2126 / JCM 17055 / OF4) TaxID=398511 RepID=D3FZ24_ALKPO|nr:hypothetical protein BpOF4_04965 [Alkalihalophilus pseudofirmus OF4]